MPDAPSLLNLFSPKNIVVFMLIFTRMSGLFATAPFFSTFQMPEQVKIWFCALISFILYPILSAKAQFIMPHSMPEFAILHRFCNRFSCKPFVCGRFYGRRTHKHSDGVIYGKCT